MNSPKILYHVTEWNEHKKNAFAEVEYGIIQIILGYLKIII
jgi:hypothetical protein